MKLNKENCIITAEPGDEITFKGIYYQVPDWWDDQPVVFVKPFLHYTEGNWESVLDDICIDICVDRNGFQFENEVEARNDIEWSGKSPECLRRVINKALKTGQPAYTSVYSEVFEAKVRFYEEPEDPEKPESEENPMELKYEIIEQHKV